MGNIETTGDKPLLSSMQVHAMVRSQALISDECAATICSWWHGPNGHGVTFSRLSHRIAGGVSFRELSDAIENARTLVPWDEGRNGDLDALSALEEWGLAKVNANV